MQILNTQNCIFKNIYEEMYSTQCENSWIFIALKKCYALLVFISNVWYAQTVPNEVKLFLENKQRLFDVLSRKETHSLNVALNVTYTSMYI